MALKTILFLGLFVLSVCGALFLPLLGILGYVAHYITGPERQWWSVGIRSWDIRYSLVLAAAAAIGMVLNFRSLRYGPKFFSRHEQFLLLFLGLIWVLHFAGETTELYTIVDHPAVKIAKVIAFGLMMTHIVTTERSLRALLWTFAVCTLILGLQAYTAPREMGRVESVGGVDFAESNFLPAFIGAMLPLIGVLFLQTRWWGKVLCLATGAFAVNAIVLTRSRGAVIGAAFGLIPAVLLAPKQFRMKVAGGLIVAALGTAYMTDPAFWGRIGTIDRSEEERDVSAQSRLDLWNLSIQMVKDHPLGIGPGNWFQTVGRYNPAFEGRDAHSTYFRCLAELGIPGFLAFAGIALHAIWVALRASRVASRIPTEAGKSLHLLCYGYTVSLCTFLGVGLTVTTLYTEALWWLLALPVCLERAVANHLEDEKLIAAQPEEAQGTAAAGGRRPHPHRQETPTTAGPEDLVRSGRSRGPL